MTFWWDKMHFYYMTGWEYSNTVFGCKWSKRKEKKGLRGKEMIKEMFPLYMFGSRERKGKKIFMYLLFVWFVKEEKCVFFTFTPSLSGQVSKRLLSKIVISKTSLHCCPIWADWKWWARWVSFALFSLLYSQPNNRKTIPSLHFFSVPSSSFHSIPNTA